MTILELFPINLIILGAIIWFYFFRFRLVSDDNDIMS